MLERYHDAIMRAVRSVGERLLEDPKLFRSSAVGVAGMSRTWSGVVSSLGLDIRRVVHVCASTMVPWLWAARSGV